MAKPEIDYMRQKENEFIKKENFRKVKCCFSCKFWDEGYGDYVSSCIKYFSKDHDGLCDKYTPKYKF